MLQAGQRLTFAAEALEDEFRVHPGPNELHRNARLILIVVALREEDRAHAAAAEFAHQAVRTGARELAGGARLEKRDESVAQTILEEPASRLMTREQRRDFAPHLIVGRALAIDRGGALAGRQQHRPIEHLADGSPLLGGHAYIDRSRRRGRPAYTPVVLPS